jgi:hypothetical protein
MDVPVHHLLVILALSTSNTHKHRVFSTFNIITSFGHSFVFVILSQQLLPFKKMSSKLEFLGDFPSKLYHFLIFFLLVSVAKIFYFMTLLKIISETCSGMLPCIIKDYDS